MPCFHPIPAYRNDTGVKLGRETPDSERLRLPCGGCLGCRASTALSWALRCHLELNDHQHAVFTTLTYDERRLPITLQKADVSNFIRELRRKRSDRRTQANDQRVRYFAAGEYGERTNRPHYHAILYGIAEHEADLIQAAWGKGFATTTRLTPRRIAYTAGYCQKKIGWRANEQEERTDYTTGEVYTWQPPFKLMSRRPGIGASARRYTDSWRDTAVLNGATIPVPRYLHEAWKQQATDDELAHLAMIRAQEVIKKDTSTARLEAQERIAEAKHNIQALRRTTV